MKIVRNMGEEISPNMIGLFFEDINSAADGGLYAELIENRSFEAREAHGTAPYFYSVEDSGYAWSPVSATANMPVMRYVCGTPLCEVNPHYLRFTATEAGQGFANQAYDGIFMKQGDELNVVFYARAVDYKGCFTVSLMEEGKSVAEAKIVPKYAIPFKPFSDLTVPLELEPGEEKDLIDSIHAMDKTNMATASSWVKYETKLVANQDIEAAKFAITLDAPGVVDFDYISAIPADAVAGVFRKDLFEALKDINPGFIRFPGGCIVEGISLENRYRWKRTVGPTIQRKVIPSLWGFCWDGQLEDNLNGTVRDSHYTQSYGLGFYEYMLLCELLGAKALPVLSIGVACQFRSTEVTDIDSEEFQEFIQDAIDFIEFANGSIDTKWGALRASMGHPESFNLEMLAIGNEQWETETLQLFERNNRFEKAIHEVYPGFKLLGTAGPTVDMKACDLAWDYYRAGLKDNPDFCYAVDEHYYTSPQWMYDRIEMYDNYPRDLAVFAGEYAAHTDKKANNMVSALAEAAFMTGFEKNAGVVRLASYAPLFYRVGHGQWIPDMIWFDATSVTLTPNYYVQKLYSNNLGAHTLEIDADTIALRKQGIYVAISETDDGEIILKVVNTSDSDYELPIVDGNGDAIQTNAHVYTLHATGDEIEGFPQPSTVDECDTALDGKLSVGAMSFVVARFK